MGFGDLRIRPRPSVLLALLVAAFTLAACQSGALSNQGAAPQSSPQAGSIPEPGKLVTDFAGRQVAVPATIERVVTIGSLPVVNSFVFAMGYGDKIVNGLPQRFDPTRYKYHFLFGPKIASSPIMEGPDYTPNIEEILRARPDVILTMQDVVIQPLEQRGLPVIYLQWREPEDIRQVIRLLGEVFGEQDRAEAYVAYFDETVQRVQRRVADIPEDKRVTVLYIDPQTMANTHLITEWWIEAAGGISVTKPIHRSESVSVTLEQVLAWNPDVIVVRTKKDAELLRSDERFASLRAVQSGRVHVTPTGAHLWAHRTSEQPLTVLWAAQTFYPDRFTDLDLAEEARSFYARFYDTELTEEQIAEILASGM